MPLLNDKLKMISCTDFRLFLKKLVKDKIEKEWSEHFINDLNLSYAVGPTTWAKGIDLSLLVNNIFNVQFESNGNFYTYDDTWSSPSQVTTIEGVGYYPQAGINFLLGATINL